jgi:hypothetical protein
MITTPYRINESVRRLSLRMARPGWDPREQPVYEDHSAAVKESVRAMRLQDLERTWQERYLSAFDTLTKMWFRFDPELHTHLSDEPRKRAEHILKLAGWL